MTAIAATAPAPAPPFVAIAAAALITLFIWGATAIVTKVLVETLDPLAAGALRPLLAAPPALAAALALHMALPRDGRAWLLLVLSALGGFVGFPVLFSYGLQQTTASHAALIMAAGPVSTGIFAYAAARRWPAPRWWLGVALALTGLALLVGLRFGFAETGATLTGDLLVFGAFVCASAGYVTGAKVAARIGTWPATCWGIALGGLLMLPFAPYSWDALQAPALTAVHYAMVAFLALISTIAAYVFWYWALAKGGVGRIGSWQFIQPIITLALAVLVLGEMLTLPLVVSAIAILAGVAIAQRA